MCIHVIYIFTLCTHHAFSRFPQRPCETHTNHMRSLAATPNTPSPRCQSRRAHPFTARLVHALCSRCHHAQKQPTTFSDPPASLSPASAVSPTTGLRTELAARSAVPALAPDDPTAADDGLLDPELAREIHPCIATVALDDWKWRATLTAPTFADPSSLTDPVRAAARFSAASSTSSKSTSSSVAPSLRSASVASSASSLSFGPGSLSRRATDLSSVTSASSGSSSSGGGGGIFARRKDVGRRATGLRELMLGTERAGEGVARVGRGMR